MEGYDNTNKGTLGRNTSKSDSNPQTAKWPDYQGKCNIEGVDYYISGWVKTSQQGVNAGQKFFSLSFTPVAGKGQQKQQQVKPVVVSDDIPF